MKVFFFEVFNLNFDGNFSWIWYECEISEMTLKFDEAFWIRTVIYDYKIANHSEWKTDKKI